MTSQNALAEKVATPPEPTVIVDDSATVETRFGTLTFQNASLIRMPRGILGYADQQTFGLANMPDPNLSQFKVLQSMEDAELSFIVLPLEPDNSCIDDVDLRTVRSFRRLRGCGRGTSAADSSRSASSKARATSS